MQALKIGDNVTLIFTTVMDEMTRGLVDEDEDADAAPTDRAYWEERGTKATVYLADQLLENARECDPSLVLKYNKFYIGLSMDGQPYNFVTFRPQKNTVRMEPKLPRTEEFDKLIEDAGIEALEYYTRSGLYRLSLEKKTLPKSANRSNN